MADDDDKKKDTHRERNDDDYAELKKALASERAARAKAEKEAKDLKAENEKRDADTRSLDDKIKDLSAKLEESNLKSLRAEVATEKGLDLRQARRLQGSTREEMEADADSMIEEFGIKARKSGKDDDLDNEESEDGTDDNEGVDRSSGRDDRKDTRRDATKRKPKEKLVSGAANNPNADDTNKSIGDIADSIMSSSMF